ncbi:MAG: YjjG family noncanonical pyrimidine nucleotidase [Rhabdochlamydiaceae bacterium]
MYEALLFDLDDTLLDFQQAEYKALSSVHRLYFSSIPYTQFFHVFKTLNHFLWQGVNRQYWLPGFVEEKRFSYLLEEFSMNLESKNIESFYQSCLLKFTDWLPHAKEALIALGKLYKIVIVTNGFTDIQKRKCQKMGLYDLIDLLIVSQEWGVSKPNPKIFQKAIESVGCYSEKALVIGDSLESDHKGAVNAGVDFCWVNIKKEKKEFGVSAPKYEVSSIKELIAILE